MGSSHRQPLKRCLRRLKSVRFGRGFAKDYHWGLLCRHVEGETATCTNPPWSATNSPAQGSSDGDLAGSIAFMNKAVRQSSNPAR
jgi:hypothetical protein